MIVGIGVDVIEPERIKAAMQRERFAARVFTDAERARIDEAKSMRYQRAAGLFAGKEAAVKALGSGFTGISFHDVEIIAEPSGRPCLLLHGGAEKIAAELGVKSAHISISHVEGIATAFVVLEG